MIYDMLHILNLALVSGEDKELEPLGPATLEHCSSAMNLSPSRMVLSSSALDLSPGPLLM